MPKSAKKRKEKVADFSKAKLKLGKGKTASSNAIDTSFKARSIFLPSQSIAVDKDATEHTTRRQLTFGDLISHLKHYNTGTRKDALLGLRELFESHWEIVASSLTPLLNAIVKIFSDEDASVRKQLISFLNWLFPKISPEDLMPHAPLVLLFITSAQTHIFPEIRIDAIRCLDILLECVPDVVMEGWDESNGGHGARVLEGYLGILNAGTKYGETAGPLKATSTASVVLTAASKLTVLKSLGKFLETALHSDSRVDTECTFDVLDAWFLETAFRSVEDFENFEQHISIPHEDHRKYLWQSRCNTNNESGDLYAQHYPVAAGFAEESWDLGEILSVVQASSQNANIASENTAFISHLANTLHSTIIETYLDVAPSVFAPGSSPTDTEIQLVVIVVRVVRTLYYPILRSRQSIEPLHLSHLESIVNYMSTYFPVVGRNSKFDSIYEEINLIYCELTSLLVNASSSNEKRSNFKKMARPGASLGRTKLSLSIQTGRVMEYITRRLHGEAASASQIGVPISARAYLACLPTIWAFMSNTHSSDVMHAVLDHALKTSSKSPSKGPTIEFVGRLVLLGLDPRCICNLGLNQDVDIAQKLELWILHLPQVLWELGNTNLSLTQTVLCILLRVLQSNSKGAQGPPSVVIESLQSRLIPYFFIDHPTRGAMIGPYKKLPPIETSAAWCESSSLTSGSEVQPRRTASSSRVRLLALDVVASCLSHSSNMSRGVVGRSTKPNGSLVRREPIGVVSPPEALTRAVGEAVSGEAERDYWIHVSRYAHSFR